MADTTIRVENLSKKYSIGTASSPSYRRLSEAFSGLPKAILRAGRTLATKRAPSLASPNGSQQDASAFWALKDVSFEVERGDVVGIVGRNGAGKSTLLKILSRITEPSSGRFGIRGRVASLLEVGTGFHQELTGRENIYVSGVILGMTRAEMKKRFDQIVEFSGVEKFLDSPVKHYSSGMQVRLGFSVAAHLESEVLIIDEVLAVGDAQFQKKCLGQLSTASSNGRTVIFVSHNLTAVNSLCNTAFWLDAGKLVEAGPVAQVIRRYEARSTQEVVERKWPQPAEAPGNSNVRLKRIAIIPDSTVGGGFVISNALRLEIEFWTFHSGLILNPSVVLYAEDGTPVFNTVPPAEGEIMGKAMEPGIYRCTCFIPSHLLNDELYRVQLHMIRDYSTCEWRLDDLLCFELSDDQPRAAWFGKWIGTVRPLLTWETVRLDSKANQAERGNSK